MEASCLYQTYVDSKQQLNTRLYLKDYICLNAGKLRTL